MGYAGNIRVNGILYPIGSSLYGTCNTPAGTVEKVVLMDDLDVLMAGITIRIKFMYENTAQNPKLNVNELGAKDIYWSNGETPNESNGSWQPGSIVTFTYDGASWMLNDNMGYDITYNDVASHCF